MFSAATTSFLTFLKNQEAAVSWGVAGTERSGDLVSAIFFKYYSSLYAHITGFVKNIVAFAAVMCEMN